MLCRVIYSTIDVVVNPETGSENLTDEQAIQFIAEYAGKWDLTEHSDENNIRFAYHVTHWIHDVLGDGSVRYNTRDIAGDDMPSSLQPLLRQEWKQEAFYSNENHIRVYKRPDFEYIAPVIPKWNELQSLVTFDEMLERAMSDPEISAGIKRPQIYVFDRMVIQFDPAFYYDWGIEFTVSPSNINAAPFGIAGKTHSPTEYILSNYNRLQLLSTTVTQLAVLAACNAVYRNGAFVDPDMPMIFEERLLGLRAVEPDISDFRSPGGMKELLVRTLIEMNKLPTDNAGSKDT